MHWRFTPMQAAFKRVKHEVEKCRQELSALLRRRLTSNPDAAADCIAMIAKLGEPTETLQVRWCLWCVSMVPITNDLNTSLLTHFRIIFGPPRQLLIRFGNEF